ncbi:MAG: DUF2341 domain-containing protein, partial [Candidatus Diapherotrites archaeon]|nr:DUF2341 domain-containing protein [Candidatus Diapherotrites archaeon]
MLTENSDSDLIGYSVLVEFDSSSLISSGTMNSDCSDLRFSNDLGNLELDYSLDSGCNTANTNVWVTVPSIPASSSTRVYVYYGSPSAVSASEQAGLLMDDFGSNTGIDASNAASMGYSWTSFNGDPWGTDNFYLTNVPGQGIAYLEKDFGEVIPYTTLETEYAWGGTTSGVTAKTEAWTGSSWVTIGSVTSFTSGVHTYNIPENTSKIKIWKYESHNNGLVIYYWKFSSVLVADPAPSFVFGVEEQSNVPTVTDISLNFDSFEIGDLISATATATDPQDDIVNYSFTVKNPSDVVFEGPITQASNEYSFTPDVTGTWTVEVTATDAEENSSSVFSEQVVVSGWWDSNWKYRKPITITDTSGSELTDFQVPVDLITGLYDNTGLVGSWHFSEGTGTRTVDSSGNGNDGTLINGPVWTTGKFGFGLQFDGVDDFVAVGSDSNLDMGV